MPVDRRSDTASRPDWFGRIRIGALPEPVGDVIDVLAVAEPMDLAALTRITGSAAVEAAEMRNLITLEPSGASVQLV